MYLASKVVDSFDGLFALILNRLNDHLDRQEFI